MPEIVFLISMRSYLSKIKNKVKTKVINKYNSIFFSSFKSETSLNIELDKNGLIKCKWLLDKKDQLNIKSSRIFCLGIRVFDITFSNSKEKSTCVMREIQINKDLSETFVDPPIRTGLLLIELGYRNPGGKWKLLSGSTLDLGRRFSRNKILDDSWFYLSPSSEDIPMSLHERMYRLSRSNRSGGSEKIHLNER